jgi:mono/diheme cytochrome c family protein
MRADLGAVAAALIVAASGIGAACAWRSWSAPEEPALLAWDDATVVARGRALYAARCAACHRAHGEGQSAASGGDPTTVPAPPHDASGHTWQHPDFALIQLTKSGKTSAACGALDPGTMPRFAATLSDRDIVDVLAYIKSTWPADIRARQDEINRLYVNQNAAVRALLDLEKS